MGMWNATCGLSFLPIRGGSVRVWAIALHPPTFGQDDHLYGPTSLATPITLAIQGEYDGYGAVERIVERDAETALLAHLRERNARGALRVGDEPLAAGLETLLRAIADGRVAGTFTPAGSSTPATPREARLSLMFADERVYRATLTAIRSSTAWETAWRVGGEKVPKDAARAMEIVFDKNPNLAFYRQPALESAELRERLAEHHDFELGLELLRRCYAPPTGVGSQSDAFDLHAELAALVAAVAREEATRSD
jgi:hypothetical protein